MLRYLPLALLIAAGLIPACTLDNPNFVESSGESTTATATATGGDGTATGTTTLDDPSGASASGNTATATTSAGPTSSASEPSTTGDPSSGTTVTTDDPTDSDSNTDTGGALELEATLAACVLTEKDTFTHVGPEECAAKAAGHAEGIQGLLLLDKEFYAQDGEGRQALIFLKFDPPNWLDNHTIKMVELHMRVAEHPNAEGSNADIHRCHPEEFVTLGDLDEEAPMSTEKLVMSVGDLAPGTESTWGWAGILALEPPRCLRLEPVSDKAALYWGLTAENPLDRPRLTITYE